MKSLEDTLSTITDLVGFKNIPGYEGRYMINESGDILRLFKNGKHITLKQHENKRGYMTVRLNLNKKGKTFRVHQLVAMTYLNHKLSGMSRVVDHIDEDKKNNHVSNLRVVSNRENTLRSSNSKNLKGAYYNKSKNQWYSRIRINGKDKYLGTFSSEIEASNAYKKAYDDVVR